jgi:RimJ/RimL family protein N-acetyltransferase
MMPASRHLITGEPRSGYGLAAPYRGRGYGREVVAALTRWLVEQVGVAQVIAHTDVGNTPSRRALERAGFPADRHAGRAVPLRKARPPPGPPGDRQV